jgi:hypothetical protein
VKKYVQLQLGEAKKQNSNYKAMGKRLLPFKRTSINAPALTDISNNSILSKGFEKNIYNLFGVVFVFAINRDR